MIYLVVSLQSDLLSHNMAKINKKTLKTSKKVIDRSADMKSKPLAAPASGPGGPMEIVFSFDTTGSMHGCIAEVTIYILVLLHSGVRGFILS